MPINRKYFLTRILLFVPTLLSITVLSFIFIHFLPFVPPEKSVSSPAMEETVLFGTTPTVAPEQIDELRTLYGLDKPLLVRYALWLKRLISLDLGTSAYYHRPALEVIVSKFPVSLSFGIFNFLLVFLICIPLGTLKAVAHKRPVDLITDVVLNCLYAIPPFVLAVLLLVFLAGDRFLGLFPLGGLRSATFEQLSTPARILDYLHHMTLPILCYTSGHLAFLTFMVKNSLLEQLQQDYVATARAKGAPEARVIFRHALRNAFVPVITHLGKYIGIFLSGSLFIETIFSLDGIGQLGYTSVMNRDYPVLLALIVLSSLAIMIGNLVSDLLYPTVDPRIDYRPL